MISKLTFPLPPREETKAIILSEFPLGCLPSADADAVREAIFDAAWSADSLAGNGLDGRSSARVGPFLANVDVSTGGVEVFREILLR